MRREVGEVQGFEIGGVMWGKQEVTELIVLATRSEKIRAEAVRQNQILKEIVLVVAEDNDQECWFDHHGYCQAHSLEKDCHVAKAKNFIEQYMKDEV